MENKETEFSLVNVITSAIQIPGVKVNRATFLCEVFEDAPPERLQLIVKEGPVQAGYSKEALRRIARKLIDERALASSGASFLAGIPGGLVMVATIPVDVLQFYAVTLRLAQELAYLYGEEDLWNGETPDEEKVVNQLILYCGAMFGVAGAAQGVRLLSAQLAKQAMKQLPRKALTKTFYYPIIKSICKAIGIKMTKEIFAKSVAKALPIVGGFVSGGITLTTMRPMGQRLANTLEQAHFNYSQETLEADWQEIMAVKEDELAHAAEPVEEVILGDEDEEEPSPLDGIEKAKNLLDSGIITEQEFAKIKAKLIAKL